MTNLLDMPLTELLTPDEEHLALLDRTARILSAELNVSYPIGALDAIERGRDAGGVTLGGALHCIRADSAYVADAIVTLERRDALAARVYEQQVTRGLDDPVNELGQVMLDDSVDVRRLLALPSERASRWARISTLTPRYHGPDGRARFELDDEIALKRARIDIVRTAERQRELEAPARVLMELDAAIAKCRSDRARLRLLAQDTDARDAPASVRDATQAALAAEAAEAGRRPLRMLDRAEKDVRILLDGKKPKKRRKLEARLFGSPLPAAAREPSPASPPESPTQAPPLRVLDGGAQSPQQPASSVANGDVDTKVRARMKQLGAPESDYAKVLEQLLDAGGA